MNRKILLLAGGACAVLLVMWFFALWQPKSDELVAERERLATAQDQAAQLETRLVKLKQAKANAPKLMAQRDRLRSAVPDSPNLPQLILDANDAAVGSGVAFVSITPSAPAPSATPGLPPEVGLSMQIEGGYFQVLDFVERVTDLQRVVVFDAVNVTPMGSKDAGPPHLTVSLTGRMFTTQLPAEVPAAAQSAAAVPSTPESTTTTTAVSS